MKPSLLLAFAATAGVLFTACDPTDPSPDPAPPKKTQAAVTEPLPDSGEIPSEPSEAERKLEKQVRDMQARDLALREQMEEERLAATEAEIQLERDLLRKDREAWLLHEELEAAKSSPVSANDGSAAVSTSSQRRDYQMFYDDLEPLGSWFDCPDYGYVWQPSVAVSDISWRPYTVGRWVSSDQGWTWLSDEPFGWACYHYGRWARLRDRGWIWVPGDQWAPAWVAWRKNENYVGWCPLPPETVYDSEVTYGASIDHDCGIYPGSYVFTPVRYFDEPVMSYCEPPPRCLTIYSTTINITNIVIRPGRVNCGGPRYDWIRECVQRPFPRYTLTCEADRPGNGRHDRRHVMENDRVRFYAPKVYAPWNTELRPARVAARLPEAGVVRGDSGLSARVASRFHHGKQQRDEAAAQTLQSGAGAQIMERQKRLAGLEKTRESLQEQRRSQLAAAAAPEVPSPANSKDKMAGQPARNDKREPITGRPERTAETVSPASPAVPPATENSKLGSARAELAKLRAAREATPAPETATPQPATATDGEQRRLARTREELESRKEQLAKLRAERAAAAGKPLPPADPPSPNEKPGKKDDRNPLAARTREAAKPQRDEADARGEKQTADQTAQQRAALEQRRREDAEQARQEKQATEQQVRKQAAMEERARQVQQAREQVAHERAAMEQQRREESAARQRENAEQQRREAQDRAREDQQRRAAEEQSRQEHMRRAAEQQERQEQQRRASEERAQQEHQRRAADEQSRQEQSRRAAEEQSRHEQHRAGEEQSRQEQHRAAEERSRQEEKSREAADHNHGKR